MSGKRVFTYDKPAIQSFAALLRKVRKEKGFTQAQLAFEADISRSSVERMERAELNPTLSTITVLARALEIKPSVLLDFEV